MTALRWWFFKKLSAIGWRVCPEPHKSLLQSVMPSWDDVRRSALQLDEEGRRE